MNRTPTEPCGTCRQPVKITPTTTRSRHSDRPLCPDCATDPPVHFEQRRYVAGETRSPNLAEGHCSNCRRVDFLQHLTRVGASHYCPQCLHDHLYPGEPSPHRSADWGWADETRMVHIDADTEFRTADLGEFRLKLPADAFSDDDVEEIENRAAELVERTFTGWAVRFGVPYRTTTVDGAPCWVTYHERAFDAQLRETDDSCPALVQLDHRGAPLGQLIEMRAEERGLWVRGIVDSSDRAMDVLGSMSLGSLPCLSQHSVPVHSVEVGKLEGLPVFECREAWLVECGPVTVPGDDGCRVLSVGGEAPMDPDWAASGRALARELLGEVR